MASYTDLDYLRNVLDARWQEDITGRNNPVPKPEIVIATDEAESRVNTAAQDVIFIRDGGPQDVQAQSVGWTEESVTTPLLADIRTSHSRVRFVGARDENNEAERYGGLYGETKRILDTIRKGESEFDWTEAPEWNDNSEDYGYGHWVGAWTVRLKQIASTIDPSP